MINFQVEGITLTSDGVEAVKVISSLYPESDNDEILSILVGLVKENPKLDYIRVKKGALQALVTTHCDSCKKDIVMSLGWIGHVRWIKTNKCSLCSRK